MDAEDPLRPSSKFQKDERTLGLDYAKAKITSRYLRARGNFQKIVEALDRDLVERWQVHRQLEAAIEAD